MNTINVENCNEDIVMRLACESIRAEVEPILQVMGVPYKNWGKTSPTKSFDDFLRAMAENEIHWEYEAHSSILEIDAAVVNVYWNNGTNIETLREKYQEFKDGTKIEKIFNGSVIEHLKGRETPRAAALRGLAQKLGGTSEGFKDPKRLLSLQLKSVEVLWPQLFPVYPPFEVIYNRRIFDLHIDNALYEIEYICKEPGVTTYSDWIVMD